MKIVEALLRGIIPRFAKVHAEKRKHIVELVRFFKFAIVGLSNTIISYSLNLLTLKMLEPFCVTWDYIAGNLVSFALSVLWSFYWNSCFVFQKESNKRTLVLKRLLKTYAAYGFTGIILSNLLSWFWITQVGISKYIAPLFNLLISVPLNYLMNRFWAFR